ncbi:MAG: hypothetical protein K2O16_04520, partial [Lachnospiraceae bacterium]|nr:hypothetical protein [Lachnospiraceae bacterium]
SAKIPLPKAIFDGFLHVTGHGVNSNMGMTNKQFQGFIRLALELIDKALTKSPDNDDLQKLKDIFQSMLEDGFQIAAALPETDD